MIIQIKKAMRVYKILKDARTNYKYIAELTLPSGSFLFSENKGAASKLRANMAIVEKIWRVDDVDRKPVTDRPTLEGITSAFGYGNIGYGQNIGKLVFPDNFDFSERQCSSGIHCFSSWEEAKNYR